MAIWFAAVGRNAKLLLNVPPTRAGRLHDADVARLLECRRARERLFATDLVADRPIEWHAIGQNQAIAEIDFGRVVRVSIARLEEDIGQGQRVARYALFAAQGGNWTPLVRGTTIGCCKLDRFAPTSLRKLRVVIKDAIATPLPLRIGLYGAALAL